MPTLSVSIEIHGDCWGQLRYLPTSNTSNPLLLAVRQEDSTPPLAGDQQPLLLVTSLGRGGVMELGGGNDLAKLPITFAKPLRGE